MPYNVCERTPPSRGAHARNLCSRTALQPTAGIYVTGARPLLATAPGCLIDLRDTLGVACRTFDTHEHGQSKAQDNRHDEADQIGNPMPSNKSEHMDPLRPADYFGHDLGNHVDVLRFDIDRKVIVGSRDLSTLSIDARDR